MAEILTSLNGAGAERLPRADRREGPGPPLEALVRALTELTLAGQPVHVSLDVNGVRGCLTVETASGAQGGCAPEAAVVPSPGHLSQQVYRGGIHLKR